MSSRTFRKAPRHAPSRGPRAGGFTLPEIVIALLILSLLLLPALISMSQGRRSLARMEDLIQFQGLAAQVIEAATREDFFRLETMDHTQLTAWSLSVLGSQLTPGVSVIPDMTTVIPGSRARVLTVRVRWTSAAESGRKIQYQSTLHRMLVPRKASLYQPVSIQK